MISLDNVMSAHAIKDLHYEWCLKILPKLGECNLNWNFQNNENSRLMKILNCSSNQTINHSSHDWKEVYSSIMTDSQPNGRLLTTNRMGAKMQTGIKTAHWSNQWYIFFRFFLFSFKEGLFPPCIEDLCYHHDDRL